MEEAILDLFGFAKSTSTNLKREAQEDFKEKHFIHLVIHSSWTCFYMFNVLKMCRNIFLLPLTTKTFLVCSMPIHILHNGSENSFQIP